MFDSSFNFFEHEKFQTKPERPLTAPVGMAKVTPWEKRFFYLVGKIKDEVKTLRILKI